MKENKGKGPGRLGFLVLAGRSVLNSIANYLNHYNGVVVVGTSSRSKEAVELIGELYHRSKRLDYLVLGGKFATSQRVVIQLKKELERIESTCKIVRMLYPPFFPHFEIWIDKVPAGFCSPGFKGAEMIRALGVTLNLKDPVIEASEILKKMGWPKIDNIIGHPVKIHHDCPTVNSPITDREITNWRVDQFGNLVFSVSYSEPKIRSLVCYDPTGDEAWFAEMPCQNEFLSYSASVELVK